MTHPPFAALLATVSLASFAIGSIPFGYLIGRFFYGTDLRTQGSGNIGAMNALRTLGKPGAAAVLVLDAAKGVLPVAAALSLPVDSPGRGHDILGSFAALFAVLGHCFSPWLGWKGGKGVATSIGAILALSWKAGLVCILAWIFAGLIVTNYSSVGSMAANAISPLALWSVTGSLWFTAYGIFAAAFIAWTHRENLARLRSGTESKIRLFKKR